MRPYLFILILIKGSELIMGDKSKCLKLITGIEENNRKKVEKYLKDINIDDRCHNHMNVGIFHLIEIHVSVEECCYIMELIQPPPSLYDQCIESRNKHIKDHIEESIRTNLLKQGHSSTIATIPKNSSSIIVMSDPLFEGFKFEWTTDGELKISL
jgi:hypothetical protein